MKRLGDADSVSQGLGHASAKTRRHYGQANQASSRHGLRPIAIEAERSVRPSVALTDPSNKFECNVTHD